MDLEGTVGPEVLRLALGRGPFLSFPRDKDSEKSRKSTLQAITSEDVFL